MDLGQGFAGADPHGVRSRFPQQSDPRQLRSDLCQTQTSVRWVHQRTGASVVGGVDQTRHSALRRSKHSQPPRRRPSREQYQKWQAPSAALVYLEPARERANLTIIDEAQVTAVILKGKKAQGLRYRKAGQECTVMTDKVVLSAGVYHSPQILMLSGIGPPSELERHGIPVIHALEGVGQNYQDHPMVTVTAKTKDNDAKLQLRGRSTLKIYYKSDPGRDTIDFHIIPREVTHIAGVGDMTGFSCNLLEQTNRGRLSVQSADPMDLPIIDPQVLEHPKDIQRMVAATRFVQTLMGTEPLSRFCGELISPGPEDREKFARSSYTSYYHGVGTCKMGPASDPIGR